MSYINPFSENFFVYKLLELLGELLKWLFVPSDGYFDNIVDDMKYSISQKIPYQDYIDMFETVQQVEGEGNISVGLNNYNFGNGLTYNNEKFIDFSWVTKYRDTWYAWTRGIIFILLIIYNINQIMKLFRGYNIASGNSRDVSNTQSSVYDFGSHTWTKGGDGK